VRRSVQLTTAVVPKVSVWNDTLPQNVNNARSVSAILIFQTAAPVLELNHPPHALWTVKLLTPIANVLGAA
jgi:hypothetical protein